MNFQATGGYPPIRLTKKAPNQPIKKILNVRGFAAPPALSIAQILNAKKQEDLANAGFNQNEQDEF
jgi:hypothetical protein